MLFWTAGKKLLYIEANKDCSCYGDDSCSCDIVITQKEVTNWEELETILYTAGGIGGLISALSKSKSNAVVAQFNQALKTAGWVNYDSVKGQKDKVMLQEKFFLITGMKNGYYSTQMKEVDLNELTDYEARQLADKDDTMLAQKITTTSLKKINPKAYKAYLAESKKKKAASERAKKGAETRKQKKLEKELAKARKLLADAEKD